MLAPCLGLAVLALSSPAQAQIRMVSPNGLAYVETQAVAQNGGFTAIGSYADGFDADGNGATDDYRGAVYLYEWGNLRLNFVPQGPEFAFANLGRTVSISSTWLAATAPQYNITAGAGTVGAVLLSKKVGGSFGPLSYVVKDSRILANAAMPIAVSDTQLVIGSQNGANAGAVFVFTYDAARNNWGTPVILTPSDGHVGDGFGSSVSIDGSRIVVGAPQQDDNLNDSLAAKGRVYVFDRSGTQWQQTFAYTALDATPGALYGSKVDVHGSRLIVSAPLAAGIGLVQILERDATTWRSRYVDYRSAMSVAIYGDKAVAGLAEYPNPGRSANRLRTYRLNGSTWSAYGGMVSKTADDYLGEVVDIHSDQVAASVRGFDYNGRNNVGAAYL
ncbi:MAG TPA: FG-GAP repeat protein, partial [Polyangiaceae bacterium]|nr:FG-GAP repeat protein [Polyangiaceae bacterium]